MIRIRQKGSPIRYVELVKEDYHFLSARAFEGIVLAAQDAFGPSMGDDEIIEHILPTDNLSIATHEGHIVGFASVIFQGKTIDFVGAAVRQGYQSSGVYSAFATRRIEIALDNHCDRVTLRTQNPRVEAGMRRSLDRFISAGLIEGYHVVRELKPGLYGRMLTVEQPRCDDQEIASLYAAVDYARGDAFSLGFLLYQAEHPFLNR